MLFSKNLKRLAARPIRHNCNQTIITDNSDTKTYKIPMPQHRDFSLLKKNVLCHAQGKPPARVFLFFVLLRTKNSPFLRFMKHKEFRCLRTATKDAVFGNCKPLKRLDLNFHKGFCDKLNSTVFRGIFSLKRLLHIAKTSFQNRK